MTEPDDPSLDPALDPWMRAALLADGLEGGPSDAQRQRMASKLAAAVGVSAVALLPAGSTAPAAASGAKLLAGKSLAILAGVFVAGGAVGMLISELRPRRAVVVPRETVPVVAAPADAGADAPSPDAAEPDAAVPQPVRGDGGVRAPRDAGAPGDAAVTSDTLARERPLIDMARSALRTGDLRLAVRNLVEYRMRFPDGALREEYQVLDIELALAQGRRQDAAMFASEFRREHPHSVFAARVDELVPR